APKLKKEDGLIDWSKPAAAVVNHVRAMQPWPTAYTFLHRPGKEPMRVIICRTGSTLVSFQWPDREPNPDAGCLMHKFGGPGWSGHVPHPCVILGTSEMLEIVEVQPA